MNALRLEFYSRLSEEYPSLPLSELSPTEEETFYARAKYWADDWEHVYDYIGTHECDILVDCVSEYDSDVSLKMFKVNLERLEEDIEEERANTGNYTLRDIDFKSNTAIVEWEQDGGKQLCESDECSRLVDDGHCDAHTYVGPREDESEEDDVTGFEVKTKLRKDGDTEHNVCFGTTDDGLRCNQITNGWFCPNHSDQTSVHPDVHPWEVQLPPYRSGQP